ncbi:MAG: linearmycin/streptolysin transport system permease protein [Petroclostridium sp.]|jgi:ABC-2 type transport system permease protein|uniref:ABC transporter permease n=1 Tax=Petroclostridium xylanilyticum TaxID=1792311 RepID=UPI000B988DDA|nr:ABC transporter permease [Petroclostridium xylanilyticum]MBZ4646457.1 family transporter protein [Clostridia bacterium]MDK2810949.1 linearmycin/streptolysin transport system permease protein [Petroclostridium sp.]
MDIITMTWYDFKKYFQDKKAVFFMMVMPLIVIFLVSYAISPLFYTNSYIDKFKIAIVDKENSIETRTLINHFESSESLKNLAEVIHTDYEYAVQLMDKDEIAAIIVIPEHFSEDVAVGKNTPVTVIGNRNKPVQSQIIKAMMTSGADLVTAAQSGVNTIWDFLKKAGASSEKLNQWFNKSVMEFSLKSLGRNQVFVKKVVSPIADISPFEYYSISIIVIFMLFNGMSGLRILIEEKHSEVLKRIISKGISVWKIILSKFISLFLFQLIQSFIIFAVLVLAADRYLRGNSMNAALVLAVIVVAVSSFMIFIASCVNSIFLADMIAYIGILTMAFIGGSIIPLTYLPASIEKVSFLSINKWAAQGLIYSVFWNRQDIVITSIGVLVLLSVVCIIGSIFSLARTAR